MLDMHIGVQFSSPTGHLSRASYFDKFQPNCIVLDMLFSLFRVVLKLFSYVFPLDSDKVEEVFIVFYRNKM